MGRCQFLEYPQRARSKEGFFLAGKVRQTSLEESQALGEEKHSKPSWLSALFYKLGHVCKMDEAHAEGVDGGAAAPRQSSAESRDEQEA
jgi:hypothetical protein